MQVTLEEIARSRSTHVTAPASALADLFRQVDDAVAKNMGREASLLGDAIHGLGVAAVIATIAGIARAVGIDASVPLLVACFAMGTLFGIAKVILWKVVFVSKRTGQDVTIAIPLVVGFGIGLAAWCVEAGCALLPLPSAASCALVAMGAFALWYARYRPAMGFDHVPALAVTELLLEMADPRVDASVAWHDPKEPPPDGIVYHAHIVTATGVEVSCACYANPPSSYLVTADFPPGSRWRHAAPTVALDGAILEHTTDASGLHVRARAHGRSVLQAISLASHACV